MKINNIGSHQPLPTGQSYANNNNSRHNPKNTKEPLESIGMLTRNLDVHTKQTTDQVHRNQDGSNESNLAKNLVDMVTQYKVSDIELGKVVGMRATKHLLEMRQVRHHGYDVILDIAQVQPNITTGGDGVLLVATLGEAADYICFAAQQAHQTHYFLAEATDAWEEGFEVVDTRDEYMIFNCFGFELHVADDWTEAIDDVVADLS